MLLARSSSHAHVRHLFVSPARGRIAQWRSMAGTPQNRRTNPHFRPGVTAGTHVAQRLREMGLNNKRKKVPPKTDRSRVNLVDERLCDDIFAYSGHTLRRHEGCDIIDLFPGVGVWSTRLNDFLKPRSHLLLEPDGERVYRPFLEPLLQRPGVRLLKKSGIEWSHLSQFMNPEFLPHQVPQTDAYPPRRNDTLLVTANLSWSPRKRFQTFPSVTQLLLYQFIQSIQSASWFQQYGLVRMLIWVVDEDKLTLVPRSIQGHRRLAIASDLFTDSVVELAGDNTPLPPRYIRDENMDMESAQNTVERMRKQGIFMPPGRQPQRHLDALSSEEKVVAGQRPPSMASRTHSTLEELTALMEATDKHDSMVSGQISRAKVYLRNRDKSFRDIMEYYQELVDVTGQYRDATDDKGRAAARRRATKLSDKLDVLGGNAQKFWFPYRDNMRAFRQSPSLLHWDRRPFEPLQVKAEEFFPNVPCALVDIQPKAPHQLIWRNGTPRKEGMPDAWEMIIQTLYNESQLTVGLQKVHYGCLQDILPTCPSLSDPARGGSPFHSHWFDLAGRTLNEKQWDEILEAWVESPFTPDLFGLLRAGYGTSFDPADVTPENPTGGLATGRMSIKNL